MIVNNFRRLRVLTALTAAMLISATANAGFDQLDVHTTTKFNPPIPFGASGQGRIFEGDPFIGREVVEVRIHWNVVVADGYDAAAIHADVRLPIDAYSGAAAQIILDGPTLGWSGSGAFNHFEATDRYNGFFGQAGTPSDWQSWGLPFDAVDVLPTSRIEIDYLIPEPATLLLLGLGGLALLRRPKES